jgi:hypothetical protein
MKMDSGGLVTPPPPPTPIPPWKPEEDEDKEDEVRSAEKGRLLLLFILMVLPLPLLLERCLLDLVLPLLPSFGAAYELLGLVAVVLSSGIAFSRCCCCCCLARNSCLL